MAYSDDAAIGIVGLGQIGGSIALDLKGKNPVSFFARSTETQKAGVAAGLELSMTLGELADRSDIIFVAVPVDQTTAVLENLSRHLGPGQIVTDVGSTKAKLMKEVRSFEWPEGVQFIGGHPMAGNDISGFKGAREGLFRDRTWILTPDGRGDSWRSESVLGFLRLITGQLHARVTVMDWEEHDNAVALVSHLEHLVALALVNLLRRSKNSSVLSRLVAGSFLDSTRVSKSKASMVIPFLSDNIYLPSVVDEFRAEIARLSNLLRDSKSLTRLWEEDSQWRTNLEEREFETELVKLSENQSVVDELLRICQEGKNLIEVDTSPEQITLKIG